MILNCIVVVGIGLLLAASDAVSLNAPTCPACTPSPTPSGSVVCAQTVDGVRREFANICEINRNNCINNKQAYALGSVGPCPPATANVAKSPVASKFFGVAGSALYGVQCGNCVGSATSAVCGRNSQARMMTFPNMCWMNLSNCYNPGMQYTLVKTGSCSVIAPSVSSQNVNGVGGVASHPNIGMINSAECGKLPIASKIQNGKDTGLFQYPWMVNIEVSYTAKGFVSDCGGTIISPRYVLTAAHCAPDAADGASTITVTVGEYRFSTPEDCVLRGGRNVCAAPVQLVTAIEVSAHPKYGNWTNDVALLKLEKTLAFNTDSVKPICLPVGAKEEARLFVGEILVVVGWGALGNGTSGDALQATTVPGVTPGNCEKAYGGRVTIQDSQMCAGGLDSKDSCAGDSGGPLMYTSLVGSKMVEYGIVSYGATCDGTSNVPGVYTRVGAFMKWILDTMKP